MKTLAFILIASLLFVGCIQAPGGAKPTDKPFDDINKKDLATPTPTASVTPAAKLQECGNPPYYPSHPPNYVYKTKADYTTLMSTHSVSYNGSAYLYPRACWSEYPPDNETRCEPLPTGPTPLQNGYLAGGNVDERLPTIYVNLTLEQYAEIKDIREPSQGGEGRKVNYIYPSIVDSDPFLEFYYCGNVGVDREGNLDVDALNEIIDSGKLNCSCKRVSPPPRLDASDIPKRPTPSVVSGPPGVEQNVDGPTRPVNIDEYPVPGPTDAPMNTGESPE